MINRLIIVQQGFICKYKDCNIRGSKPQRAARLRANAEGIVKQNMGLVYARANACQACICRTALMGVPISHHYVASAPHAVQLTLANLKYSRLYDASIT